MAPGLTKVEQANAERERWQAAATDGDAEAQFRYGNTFCCGEGFYDTDSAVLWWCRAADQGHPQARQALITQKAESRCARILSAVPVTATR